jgi:DNA-binding NarL/FixJ family response regulator
MINLGIIEDNAIVNQSLVDYFQHDEDVLVVAVATHVDEFYNNIIIVPDVLLLDLYLPYKNGMDSIRELTTRYPELSIIIHSVADDYESIFHCICNGAQSYLTKGESLDKVKEAILITYHGGSLMSVEIARKIVDFLARPETKIQQNEITSLNSKEMEIVNLIVEGRSYKMVASELEISINTVRKHIKSIYRKLNINTNMELANLYYKKS